jgi:cell division septum initiation protein DivIVA
MTATGTELLTELVDERTRLLAENERLRGRVLDLEAKVAILCGSLAKRAVMPEDDQPAIIHHDVKPNAPR